MGKIGQAVTEGKEGGRRAALKGADSFIRQRNLTYCCRMLHEAWYTCSCHTTPTLPLCPRLGLQQSPSPNSHINLRAKCFRRAKMHVVAAAHSPPGGALITLKCGRRCAAAAGDRERVGRGRDAKLLHLDAASSLQELRTVSTDRNRQHKPAGELS